MSKIRLAIVGVGNCASNFVQGISYYNTRADKRAGLMNEQIGGYKITDILPVAAFDVDSRKVGKDLSEAVFAPPNCTPRIADVPSLKVEVKMGPVMDGVTEHLRDFVKVAEREPVNVGKVLREAGVDVLVNILPTGSERAARFYAGAAIEAGVGIVNGIPVLLTHDPEFVRAAETAKVPIVGDDFKSQVGGTALHRALIDLFVKRGIRLTEMTQLNYGGNTDFYNLIEWERGKTKHASKHRGTTATLPYDVPLSINVSWLEILGDRKICRIEMKGENFGGAPISLEARLEVVDSANSSGVLADAIRYCKLARDRGVGGVLHSASAYLMKSPAIQLSDEEAIRNLEEFVSGTRER